MRHLLSFLFLFFCLWGGKCAEGLAISAATAAAPSAEQELCALAAEALSADTIIEEPFFPMADSLSPASMVAAASDTLSASLPLRLKKKDLRKLKLEAFQPNPKRALWLALVLPGAGQIYNRKFWKLPIFYGGFLGCTYAFLWNQQMYRDYSQAYLDITDSDANTKSYLDFLPPNFNMEGREKQFQTLFKNRRDRYRRYRDMSIFAFVGVYLLSVVDAYVDAQLSQFDISPDLSLRIEPAIIGNTSTTAPALHRSAYGIGCSLRF